MKQTGLIPPQVLSPLQELRIAKEYWLRTILPKIRGRKLHAVELHLANHAFRDCLQPAIRKAQEWNQSTEGQALPISPLEFPNFTTPDFCPPEPIYSDDLDPINLATIAAALIEKDGSCSDPRKAVEKAHQLLIAAEYYISAFPEKPLHTEIKTLDHFELAFSKVSFDEIELSNKADWPGIPLLPPVSYSGPEKPVGRQKTARNLSRRAIEAAVEKNLKGKFSSISKADYAREPMQDDAFAKAATLFKPGNSRPLTYQEWKQGNEKVIRECLENGYISLSDLCRLRWQRFHDFWVEQSSRARKRKPSKKKPRPHQA